MGCLQVQIEQVIPPLPVATGVSDDLSVSCGLAKGYLPDCFVHTSLLKPDLNLYSMINPSLFDLGANVVSPQITVTVALVCKTGLNSEEYLMVLEGNVILIDGQFVKVLKA